METFTIGQLAKKENVNLETIRIIGQKGGEINDHKMQN